MDNEKGATSLLTVGVRLFAGCYGPIEVYNRQTWEVEKTMEGHVDWVSSLVTFNSLLISGSNDKTIKIYLPPASSGACWRGIQVLYCRWLSTETVSSVALKT